MNNLALHWKILIGMLLGVIFGVLMLQFNYGKDLVVDWIKPLGTIFINALKLIAIPLILASLIKGVSDLKDIAKLSKMGGRTVLLYMITTVTAVTIGLGIVNLIQPGKIVSKEAQAKLVEAYAEDAASKQIIANEQMADGPLQPLIDIVPSNIVDSASETLVGSMAIIQFLMNLVGGATGIASLFSNSQQRLFGILATIISSATFIITLSVMLIGFATK